MTMMDDNPRTLTHAHSYRVFCSVSPAGPSTMASSNKILVLFVLAGFGSSCLMAPAAAGGSRLWEPGSLFTYSYEATVLLNDAGGYGKDVGFQVQGRLTVQTVWQSGLNRLLQLKLINPKLLIKSRKAPSPEGFVSHESKLEESQNGPFLVHWSNGHVKSVYVNQNEPIAMINLKKGIASVFQFQLSSQDVVESDASGLCSVQYSQLDSNMIEKVKTNCEPESGLPLIKHPEQMWSADVSSKRRSIIVLTHDLSAVDTIDCQEQHELTLPLRHEAGGQVLSQLHIKLQDRSEGSLLVHQSSVDAAVKEIESSSKQSFAKHPLTLTKENNVCSDGSCPSLFSMVKENREALQDENLGTIRSASAFVKLINVARESTTEELVKTLKNSKNKNIQFQLMDLLGVAQTMQAHQAALKVLDFKSEESLDRNERYLWSLSLGSHPVIEIIHDLVKTLQSGPYNEKLEETMILTIAAMTNKLRKNNETASERTVREVVQLLSSRLKKCSPSDDGCCLKYIRGFKNLAVIESVPTLLSYATKGSKKVSVAAVKAVQSFPSSYWSDDVIKAAKKIYFQLDRKYDSSARTLALDILLESGPGEELLSQLLLSLNSQDPAYEVKQYLLQRVTQIGESDSSFASSVQNLLKTLKLTNYHVLSQKGLSTAFTRHFMKHPSANGTLSTVQEMSGGIVKRGLVDVIIKKDESTQSIFTLGLFAGGLGAFLSSDDNNSEEEEEEVAIAGMDLTVLGVQVRPFVFFTGQGELMGHVWSGTASDKTPAFQAVGLLQDHSQFIPLEVGFLAELSLQGGISFDLSGQISLSIWNRNAESLVEKSAGLSITGLIRVNTLFVHSQVQFNLATEVKLRLVSNIDFYDKIALCLQLQQPDSVIKQNIHKVERIPGSKHRLRKSKYEVITVPGKTYALNKKNNELCNVIFAE